MNGRMGVRGQRARLPIDIEPQHAREKIAINPLAVLKLVVAAAFVTNRQVEITVRTKEELTTVVICRFVELRDQRLLRSAVRRVCVIRRNLKSSEPIMESGAAACRG